MLDQGLLLVTFILIRAVTCQSCFLLQTKSQTRRSPNHSFSQKPAFPAPNSERARQRPNDCPPKRGAAVLTLGWLALAGQFSDGSRDPLYFRENPFSGTQKVGPVWPTTGNDPPCESTSFRVFAAHCNQQLAACNETEAANRLRGTLPSACIQTLRCTISAEI